MMGKRPWTIKDDDQLRVLAATGETSGSIAVRLEAGMKTPAIALKLRRTVSAVRTRKDVLNKREARLKAKGK
jgi:hypothetical protein